VFQVLKVTGESLSPFFLHGDYVLVVKLSYVVRRLKAGDVVVFRHPVYGVMIKRLEQLSTDGEELYVLGSHPDSNDSRRFGPVHRRWLIGKVMWRIGRSTAEGEIE